MNDFDLKLLLAYGFSQTAGLFTRCCDCQQIVFVVAGGFCFSVVSSAAKCQSASTASTVPTSACEGSLCSKYWSVKPFLSEKAFPAFPLAGRECKQAMLHFIGRYRGAEKSGSKGRSVKTFGLSKTAGGNRKVVCCVTSCCHIVSHRRDDCTSE